ncbi:MAG TPA: galactokinase [Longilinea sp.]|nr:galactokinase [Longilinea sp.]
MSATETTSKIFVTAPGRVNLLGEHVDYNGGVVLPVAIDRRVSLTAHPQPGNWVSLQAVDLSQSVAFSLNQLDEKIDSNGAPLPSWALYPAGVAWVLNNHNYKVKGTHVSFTSDIPMGAGLSSSAAVEVAFAALWQIMGGWETDRLTLAKYCQEAENQYVGVNCGLMDQFASANGVEGHALFFDTRNLEWHPAPLPPGTVLIIANSNIPHSLANSAYNERRADCEEAVAKLKIALPGIHYLRDVSPAQFDQHAGLLSVREEKRARHVVEECARMDPALEALNNGDATAFGQLMNECHHSLRDLYEVSTPELDILAEIAQALPGCYGARLTGAGFGGCTVNLVKTDQANAFIHALGDKYTQATGIKSDIYLCRASRGVEARRL